ncbi:MAG: hypothetical protein MI922_10305 [Bacteroidales bacterium]|nr:hypothetical protein [Bacteroidales bacterium]
MKIVKRLKNRRLAIVLAIGLLCSTNVFGQSDDFLINDRRAGIFMAGEQIPFAKAQELSFVMNIKYEVKSTPDGDFHEPQFLFFIDDEKMLKIIPGYDSKTNSFNQTIGEIIIYSEKFKTKSGIGVGSNIEDFAKSYPDYELWYTYISDMYGMDTEKERAQFLLNETDYTKEVTFDSDRTVLNKKDFKENTKIETIRLY